ncbi:cysteine proteinase inhibitor 1-like [Salvia hispanica]|uniref:cysteine proteinase inhibitor 1-like n=1 Tax=Salvia hispanica TaxID=49212 RepID=UPI002009D133|nr:cysteine proteinase inhibitor 1-like [Salvia hispanica]
MASKSVPILLVILSIVAVVAATSLDRAGGWKPIGNPNAAQVVAVANFAVAEYNKEKKTSLVLVSVEKGESQVVSGINYRLLISAKDGAAEKTYSTVVYSSLAGSISLRSFDPIQN